MSTAKAKTINLLLEDGSLNGVMFIQDSCWNSGELYSAPRDSINDLLSSGACKKYGVYLLISDEIVYVGQSMNLQSRIKQHLSGKEWWNRAVILTTTDDSLNRSDIDYIEASLIKKASENDKLSCDNKKSGNPQRVTKFREIELKQYLEEAYLLIELIGISVFVKRKKKTKNKNKTKNIPNPKKTISVKNICDDKTSTKAFLISKGYLLNNSFTYAKQQDRRNEYWANPNIKFLTSDWDIVLNNKNRRTITCIKVPANTFSVNTISKNCLKIRRDKPNEVDLNINIDTLIDKISGCDFNKYVSKIFKY